MLLFIYLIKVVQLHAFRALCPTRLHSTTSFPPPQTTMATSSMPSCPLRGRQGPKPKSSFLKNPLPFLPGPSH